MSEPARQRRTEGAVIVVGDAPLAGRLRRALGADEAGAAGGENGRASGGRVVGVNHYLAVLGEMSRGPVAAVVGRLRPLRSSLEATVRAMRSLAPTAKLLLVAEAQEEPEAMRAVRLGFDDYHVEPLKLKPLLAQLPAESAALVAPGNEVEDAQALEALAENGLETAQSGGPRPRFENFDAPHPSAGGEASTGDVDLVEQLLRDRRGLRKAAVRKLRRVLEDPELRFSRQSVPAAHACVPVHIATEQAGYLVSDQTDADTLAAYADWLGRWLMLARHLQQLNDMAMRDGLTGVWNRRYFEHSLRTLVDRAKAERFRVTLMIFDIDDFKDYNDRYGHGAGDEILREAARLMQSVVRKHDVVARIGGDEFAVIFWDAEPPRKAGEQSQHPHSVRRAAERFQQAICEHRFPKLAEQAPGTLTISGGLASYPWDGRTPEELIELADEMLLESKNQGKNAITFGPGALRACGMDEGAASAGE